MDLLVMEVLIEQIVIYGGVALLCLVVVVIYLRKQKRESKSVEEKIEKAKKEGRSDRAIVHAEEILKTAAETVLSAEDASQLRWHESKDRTIADQMRVKMLEIGAAVFAETEN